MWCLSPAESAYFSSRLALSAEAQCSMCPLSAGSSSIPEGHGPDCQIPGKQARAGGLDSGVPLRARSVLLSILPRCCCNVGHAELQSATLQHCQTSIKLLASPRARLASVIVASCMQTSSSHAKTSGGGHCCGGRCGDLDLNFPGAWSPHLLPHHWPPPGRNTKLKHNTVVQWSFSGFQAVARP